MNPDEAAHAAEILKPKIVIPIHYDHTDETAKEAEEFKNIYKGFVRILKKS